MAEGTLDGRPTTGPAPTLWSALVRIFQVTLDPKKLLLAAVGITVMGIGWYVLARIAYGASDRPDEKSPAYGLSTLGVSTEAERKAIFDRHFESWKLLHRLAGESNELDGPGGSLRYLPWFEDRGPNPFLLVAGESKTPWSWYGEAKVLLEPLVKFVKPVYFLFNHHATFGIRLYLLGVIAWTLLTWAFFGGMITRLAAVELAGKDPLTIREAARFVLSRYAVYVSAPLVPLVVVLGLVVLQIAFGVVQLIPILGDIVIDGLGFPVVIALAIAQTLLLVGLIGYPLMFATVSVEGNDTLDAISRTYNYVFQSIGRYLGYSLAALVFGAVLMFFVGFLGSTVAYLSKWGLNQTPFSQVGSMDRKPEFLFVYAPTSFGWRDLLLQGTPAVDPDGWIRYENPPATPANPNPQTNYNHWIDGDPVTKEGGFTWYNKVGAFLVACWLGLLFLLVLGFGYAFFWVAGTQIYYLMRLRVDDTDLDEVYLEDETAEEPFSPPPAAPPATVTSGSVTMVDAPALRSPPPATPIPPPAAPLVERPATLPEPPAAPPPEGDKPV